ncbi:MAG TPA: FAD-linked oxidase C-terminal domain-containing protein [Parvibaculum sp.]|uniref:FAD-binding oxidoreductase n=1 Tax=Parvibaculum sp. TaxID=2024848 RepID=UPI002BDF550C|nr:FAD-linked oxidase C-terminal domain-containing protein [Parvibaculum sp.]HMM13841.1 FAD-linked oxidase C-terminal domain-containing protein [Parvibaculum sp.]
MAHAGERARQSAIDELRALAGERLVTSAAVREAHGRDESWHPCVPPDAVLFAETTEEVSAAVRICARHRLPVIPFGTGTSLEGHISAPHGGLSLDLSRMNRIISVNAADLDAHVEAGVTRKALNAYLRDTGLFFPIDPGADASLGGMAATRASGTNAVRYGTMRENVLNLTAVMADGRIVRTARRARKSAAGYDLTRLLVGSEGTLGIITELTVRLYGIPEAISSGIVSFPAFEGAIDAVIATIQSGLPVARIEFLDEVQVAACNRYSKLTLPETALLLVEFHGSEASVVQQAERFGAIARDNGGGAFEWATRAEERTRLWEARHNALYAALALQPGKKGMISDVCVPISRLAEAVAGTKADLASSPLVAPIVGHVGDGNFHLIMLVDPSNAAEMAEARRIHDRMVDRALALDGTCTGEHGIGEGKIRFLEAEHGEGIAVMRAIKRALDPLNILNPGKMFTL